MELVCKICGSSAFEVFANGVECYKCESVTVKEVPSESEISYFYRYYNDTYTGGGSGNGANQKSYSKAYLRLVKKYSNKAKSLIDIGCSTSPFPNIAYANGFNVTACDFEKPAQLVEGVNFVRGGLDSKSIIESTAAQYDIVTAWAVIEHVANPSAAFNNLAELVKTNGLLFLTTPEIGTWFTRNAPGKTPWFYPPEHLYILSATAMKSLAQQSGFELMKFGHFEVSLLRYCLRYGLGCAEGLVGVAIKATNSLLFQKLKRTRKQKFAGIAYYVFKKLPT